jgi:hypothetical protein
LIASQSFQAGRYHGRRYHPQPLGGSASRPEGPRGAAQSQYGSGKARHSGGGAVKTRAAGKGFPTPDGYIAAIAAAHGFAVASRDTSAFNAAGLTVIDPWTVISR